MHDFPGRDASGRKFTEDAIRAIEDLELRRITRSAHELADAAWEKLQYDLPVVEPCELAALVDRLRCSLHGKVSWPCYVLTQKALENMMSGARRSTSFAPDIPKQEQQLQQQLADSISASMSGKASYCSKYSGRKSAVAGQAEGGSSTQHHHAKNPLQDLYQLLCAVVFLQYIAKVVSLSEQDAWQLLQHYYPEQQLDSEQQQQQQPGDRACQQQLQEQCMSEHLSAGLLQTGHTAVSSGSHTQPAENAATDFVYESVEAAVQDEDGDEYEACEAPDTAQHARRSVSDAWHQHQHHQPYSWLRLRRRLLAVGSQVNYELLCHDALWQQQAAAEHVLQVLRALGAHSRAAELQPMVHAYAGVLVDRIAAAPSDMFLLQQLWESLGLTGQGCACSGTATVARGGGTQQGQLSNMHLRGQGLPAEAVLGLTAAASVWQQVPGTASRGRLWRLMYENLLPLLEQCTEQLAYCSSSNHARMVKPGDSVSDVTGVNAAQQQQVEGERLAHGLLVSHIIELLILVRPTSVDAAGQLTQLGVTRNLAQLFVQHCSDIAAEPLRRALLLCCCSSQQTADWVLAVPAVRQQLQQPIFRPGGPAEAHGAVWEVILSKDSLAVPAASVATAKSSGTGCQSMMSLLQMLPDSAQQLHRQVVLLQLMSDAQQAAGRQRLWEETVVAAVEQLAVVLKDSQAASNKLNIGVGERVKEAKTIADTAVTKAGSDPNPPVEGGNDMQDSSKGLMKAVSADVVLGSSHEQRHSHQLRLVVLKCIKQMLTHGTKTD